jgi:hypothetical protein
MTFRTVVARWRPQLSTIGNLPCQKLGWPAISEISCVQRPTAESIVKSMARGENLRSGIAKTPLTKTYAHDIKAMIAAAPDAGLFYVCTPNNPTGTMTPHPAIEQQSNCFMLDTKRPAKEVIDAMAARNVYIGRPWPVWPTHVRITIGTQPEMEAFQEAFQAVMTNAKTMGFAPSLPKRRSYPDGQGWPEISS